MKEIKYEYDEIENLMQREKIEYNKEKNNKEYVKKGKKIIEG